MKKIKIAINRFLKLFGFVIQKETTEFLKQVVTICESNEVEIIFDVGANTGQYGRLLMKNNFRGKLVSFEPQSFAHLKLSREARNWPNWDVAERCVLGDKEVDSIELFIADNSVSSSLLKKSHENPELFNEVGVERVKMIRLESFYRKMHNEEKFFLKMDTQGYDLNVLKGCDSILDYCVAIQFEASIFEIYVGSPRFSEILLWLEDRGFMIYDCLPEARNQSGRLLEMDLLMINQKYV